MKDESKNTCVVCGNSSTIVITEASEAAHDQRYCDEHGQDYVKSLTDQLRMDTNRASNSFRIRAVVFGPNPEERSTYLEFADGFCQRLKLGLCEAALLRHALLGSLPTIHQAIPTLASLLSVDHILTEIVVDRLDSSIDGARLIFRNSVDEEIELRTRPTDAIAVAIVAEIPMIMSEEIC